LSKGNKAGNRHWYHQNFMLNRGRKDGRNFFRDTVSDASKRLPVTLLSKGLETPDQSANQLKKKRPTKPLLMIREE